MCRLVNYKNKMDITKLYESFNYSKVGTYVFVTPIEKQGYVKIEHLLPEKVKTVSGVQFVAAVNSPLELIGYVGLTFNEGIFKTLQLPVLNTNVIRRVEHPKALYELSINSPLVQGYFLNLIPNVPFKLTTYLHY